MFSIVVFLLCVVIFIPQSFALTEESQKILNNYRNFEKTGSPPATSQPYSPNNSPPQINAVPVPKTNVIPPTTSQPSNSFSNPTMSQSQNNSGSWMIGGVIVIIIIAVIIKAISGSKQNTYSQTTYSQEILQRRGWTELEKEQVRIYQDSKCNKCGRPPPRWEYHHRDGNRSNNSLRNCEGLCPNCHSVKTHDE